MAGWPQKNQQQVNELDLIPESTLERLRMLRDMVRREGQAVLDCAAQLSSSAVQAAEMTAACRGCVIVTGVGKAGLVGQKLVATLGSTGNAAHFLHPSEAIHGDLGRVRDTDLVWAISNSGRSEEVSRIASYLKQNASGLIAITSDDKNPLAVEADCVVTIGKHKEACPLGLAPSSSTATMMATGDAIALLASRIKQFTASDFARFHPGGSLGKKLATVDQMMRPLSACRIANDQVSIRTAIASRSASGRRSGAVLLTNEQGQLSGIFTDSDLARLLEARDDSVLDDPISTRMSAQPKTCVTGSSLGDAMATMSNLKISELPVLDAGHQPLGLLDITDLVALGTPPNGPAVLSMSR